MWLLHPLPQANGNYATLGMHYAALGLPRPSVYGSPQAAGGALGAGIMAMIPRPAM